MKVLQTILFLSLVLTARAQEDTLTYPTFRDLTPVWEYHFEDVNAPQDSFADRFFNNSMFHLKVDGEAVFFNTRTEVEGDVFEDNGGVLVRLDPQTGQEVCRYSYNDYAGVQPKEYFNTVFFDGDVIHLQGAQQVDTSVNLGPLGWSTTYGEPYRHKRRTIDVATCMEVEVLADELDTVGARENSAWNVRFVETTDPDRFLAFTWTPYFAEYTFCDLGPDLSIDSSSVRTLFHMGNDPSVNEFTNFIYRWSKDELVGWFYQTDWQFISTPEMAKLVVMEISNPDSIYVSKEVDITNMTSDPVPIPPPPLRLSDNLEGPYVFSSNYFRAPGDFPTWLIWLDEDHNVLYNTMEVGLDDGYQYQDLRTLYVDENRLDMFAFPSSSGQPGWDIISIDRDGTVTKRAEWFLEGDVEFIQFRNTKIIGDKMIVGANVDGKNLAIYAFDVADVGLDPLTSIEDLGPFRPHASRVQATPNPASDYVSVAIPEGQAYTYHVVTMGGKRVAEGTFATGGDYTVDVADLPVGYYFVRCISGSDQVYIANFVKQ